MEHNTMIATFKEPLVFVANLRAALRAACLDGARVHMCCVRVELRDGCARFVATNGHWLWINETPVDVEGGACATIHIAPEDVKSIVAAVDKTKKASHLPVGLNVSDDGKACKVYQVGRPTLEVALKATAFPPYAQIIPQAAGGATVNATFDGYLMLQIAGAFADVAPAKKVALMTMHTIKDHGTLPEPIVITSEYAPEALAILMPCKTNRPAAAPLLAKYRGGSAKAA